MVSLKKKFYGKIIRFDFIRYDGNVSAGRDGKP